MNDMAFGGGSEMLRDGDLGGHRALVESGMRYYFPFALWRVPETFIQDFHPYRTIALACTIDYADPR